MSAAKNLNIDDIFSFYDRRGYRHSIGPGHCPAILVVDFSNAFTSGHTDFPGGDFAEEVRQTRRILDTARLKTLPIFYTTIAYNNPEKEAGLWGKKVPWLVHCREGTRAVEIDSSLGVRPDEIVIIKKYPSGFFETELDRLLAERGVDTIVLTGCTTSVCVRATAIDAMQRRYRTIIAAEAVGEFDAALHAIHLRDLDARYADVVSVEQILLYLERVKANPGTRSLSE